MEILTVNKQIFLEHSYNTSMLAEKKGPYQWIERQNKKKRPLLMYGNAKLEKLKVEYYTPLGLTHYICHPRS